MGFKFNWGHAIFIVMALFIIFIMSFVYKTLFDKEYDHKLVSEEYYKDEILYQNEINRMNNAAALKQNVKLTKSNEGIFVIFPDIFDPAKITGNIELQRANDDKLDLILNLQLEGLHMKIPNEILVKGNYTIKVVWDYESMPFQITEKFNY